MRPGYRIFCGLLGALVFVILSSCQKTVINDKDLIRQRLQQMAAAVEKHQVTAFLEGVDQDFLGQGSLRKANLAGLLLLQYRQHASISVKLFDIVIRLDDEQRAAASMQADLHQAGWLGQGRLLQIQTRWQKRDGEWLVERARWKTAN